VREFVSKRPYLIQAIITAITIFVFVLLYINDQNLQETNEIQDKRIIRVERLSIDDLLKQLNSEKEQNFLNELERKIADSENSDKQDNEEGSVGNEPQSSTGTGIGGSSSGSSGNIPAPPSPASPINPNPPSQNPPTNIPPNNPPPNNPGNSGLGNQVQGVLDGVCTITEQAAGICL
jgi:hypothetical protein